MLVPGSALSDQVARCETIIDIQRKAYEENLVQCRKQQARNTRDQIRDAAQPCV